MENNSLLNQKNNDLNSMYIQSRCDKHEFILATQTTSTTKEGKTEINKSVTWLQCKNCGYTPTNSQLTPDVIIHN